MIDEKILIKRVEERSKEYNSGVRLHGKPEEICTCDVIDIINELAHKPKLPHKTIYEQMREKQAERYAWQNRK